MRVLAPGLLLCSLIPAAPGLAQSTAELEREGQSTDDVLVHGMGYAAPGEPGGDTWPAGMYLRGGGATWLTGSYDPKLDLVYWGIGNPSPWNAAVRPGDNLYTNAIVAVRPKTGQMVWHYQTTPNDGYAYDGVNELILAELELDGQRRDVVMQASRNGFFYVLNALEMSMSYELFEPEWTEGALYTGADFRFIVDSGGRAVGRLRAFDPVAGKEIWEVPVDPPPNGGTLSAAGDLVFTGLQTGELVAYDARDGTALWRFQTGSGIIAPPVTYALDGVQYLAVVGGSGGAMSWYLPFEGFTQMNKGGLLTAFRLFPD